MATLCSLTFLIGVLMFALQYEWIVFRIPLSTTTTTDSQIKTKKTVSIHYWHHERWHTEKQELIWSKNLTENLYTTISNWLSTIDAEQIIPKKITLQSATILPNKQDVYLSFDHNILSKEWSTFEKWMLIESLLKTIRENALPIQRIYFLVHHQPLHDPHLDFTNSWPIDGFITLK